MSDRTTSPVCAQSEPTTTEPVNSTAAPAEQAAAEQPAPEAAVAQGSAQAADQAAAVEAAARDEADRTLKATVSAYRRGEKAYRAGLLEAGRLADAYCHQRMALGDKRAAAVQAIEGELSKWASSTVDANRLIGVYHAHRLLAEEPGLAKKADAVPYGHYRDGWVQLLVRVDKDGPAESWRLLPGLEDTCRAAFAEAVANALSKPAVQDAVKAVVRQHAERQAAETKAAAERQAAAERGAKAAAEAKAAEVAKVKAEAEQAARAAAEAKDQERAERTRQAEAAKAELLAKQREHAAAVEAAAQAAQHKARAEEEARKAAERQQAAEAKAARQAEARGRKQQDEQADASTPRRAVAENLLRGREPAGVEQAVAWAVELIVSNDAPDDVLAGLLDKVAKSAELSATAKRAAQAALVILRRNDRTNPVNVAAQLAAGESRPEAVNGHVAAVA